MLSRRPQGPRSIARSVRGDPLPAPAPPVEEFDDESSDEDVDFVRRVVKSEPGADGSKLVRDYYCVAGFDGTFLAMPRARTLYKCETSSAQPTEMACLDYVPSTAIRPVDLSDSLRPIKSQRKIRLLIGARVRCVTVMREVVRL